MADLPLTVIECDGCGEDLNVMAEHLSVQVKAIQQVLVTEAVPPPGELAIPEQSVYLGTRSGRGVIRRFHDFKCLHAWVDKRKTLKAKMEPHVEDEIYEPEDNRSPEQLVKDGVLPKEALALSAALNKEADNA